MNPAWRSYNRPICKKCVWLAEMEDNPEHSYCSYRIKTGKLKQSKGTDHSCPHFIQYVPRHIRYLRDKLNEKI